MSFFRRPKEAKPAGLYEHDKTPKNKDEYYKVESQRAIDEAIRQSAGKSPAEVRSAIRRNYPFHNGARRGREYKIWNRLVLQKEQELGLPQQKYRKNTGPAGGGADEK